MKTIYQLNKEIADCVQMLKENTNWLRIYKPESIEYRKAMEARHQIMISIMHRQAEAIKVYEKSLLSNVVAINRKAA